MFAPGILPDEVITDHRSLGLFLFAELDDGLGRDGTCDWLRAVTEILADANADRTSDRDLTVCFGLGPSFFLAGQTTRFGIDPANVPLGFRTPTELPSERPLRHSDAVFYLMCRSEAAAASFLQNVHATRTFGLKSLALERGFQRKNRREMFGYLDGLHNAPWPHRYRAAFVNRDEGSAGEPPWTEDGSYMAYLKIKQDLDAWATLSEPEQDQLIGRRKRDGKRLDIPEGEEIKVGAEGSYRGVPPRLDSHVRKARPFPEDPFETMIFRRGVPYVEISEEGYPEAGLHFVSFQHSLAAFSTIFGTWMMNPDFPDEGVGKDPLFPGSRFTTPKFGGFFFMPPMGNEFIGEGAFESPELGPPARTYGKVFVRKKVEDPNGGMVAIDLRGISFHVLRADNRSPVGEVFETDSQGHALSGELPVDIDLVLVEAGAPPQLEPAPEIVFRVERHREVQEITNRVRPRGPS